MLVIDRSRIDAWEKCPRKRYWGYEYECWGIEPVHTGIPLLTGSLIHEPLGECLNAARRKELPDLAGIISRAQVAYRREVLDRGVVADTFDGSDENAGKVLTAINWQIEEQLAQIEALVIGWAALRLPALIVEFDILDVEREEVFKFPEGELALMARTDALLRRKGSDELFVLNFKTVSDANRQWQEQWAYDQQTISEVVAVEQRIKERVSGVLIEGLVKGKRNLQYPRDSGQWRHNSPLLYGWKKENAPFTEYAFQYEYKDAMGVNHRLGRGWERFEVAKEMPIREWIQKIANEQPTLLRAQFINLPAIMRSDYVVEHWIKTNEWRELRIGVSPAGDDLDAAFPMHTSHGNCLRPGRCEFFDLCHSMADPTNPQWFKPRVANHPIEEELTAHVHRCRVPRGE